MNTQRIALMLSSYRRDYMAKKKNKLKLEKVKGAKKTGGSSYIEGIRTIKDLFAPYTVVVKDEETLKVNDRFVRSFVLQNYPNQVYVSWLDKIFSHKGEIDTMIYVEPQEGRSAVDELNKRIVELQSQLDIEWKKGLVNNVNRYREEIRQLEVEKAKIEMNVENSYKIGVFSNLFSNSQEQLNKESKLLMNELKGQMMTFIPTSLRPLEGYKTALPAMNNVYGDKLRNITSGALSACFPFYDAEICHEDGVFLGVNLATGSPLFLNVFEKDKLNNTNISIFGQAGSGKSYAVSAYLMRNILRGMKVVVIDPEGEYANLAKAMGGINIDLSPNSKTKINPFDIEEEEEIDEETMKPTGRVIVNIKEKISDVVLFISAMAKNLTQEQISLITSIVMDLYKRFGIDETPESLYVEQQNYNPVTQEYLIEKVKKKMPTFSDFHILLGNYANKVASYKILQPVYNSLLMFRKGGAYDLFDGESNISPTAMIEAPIINFNVVKLDESVLRPLGMYVAMTYAWEKFAKKQVGVRKAVVCDEAWMLLDKSKAGYEYTGAFMQLFARRIRKRAGSFITASQNFKEFTNSIYGQSVIDNSAFKIFLKQDSNDRHLIKEKFNLSDGEVNFITGAGTGDFLLKTPVSSTIGRMVTSEWEHNLLTKKNRANVLVKD